MPNFKLGFKRLQPVLPAQLSIQNSIFLNKYSRSSKRKNMRRIQLYFAIRIFRSTVSLSKPDHLNPTPQAIFKYNIFEFPEAFELGYPLEVIRVNGLGYTAKKLH
jgi:hypothetical protein